MIASARHWLEWRLDRLLAPLAITEGEPALETLQGQSDQTAATQAKAQNIAALIEPCAATARQRAEHRALRLFINTPECRDLLSCLSLQDPACCVSMEWLNSLAVVAVAGAIAGMALQLAG